MAQQGTRTGLDSGEKVSLYPEGNPQGSARNSEVQNQSAVGRWWTMKIRWRVPGEAAKHLGLSRSGVLWLVDTGRLRAVRTETGRRLISARDLERLRQEREQRAQASAMEEG
jgi:excisionase family DNA binding protein